MIVILRKRGYKCTVMRMSNERRRGGRTDSGVCLSAKTTNRQDKTNDEEKKEHRKGRRKYKNGVWGTGKQNKRTTTETQ